MAMAGKHILCRLGRNRRYFITGAIHLNKIERRQRHKHIAEVSGKIDQNSFIHKFGLNNISARGRIYP
jgi:hypothetical protein